MATLMERLAFLQKVPTLMKATSDDDTPCPGYLFEEIGKISHESAGCCQCLLEYLLERLQSDSCHVKLKALKLLQHLCGVGSPPFVTELRRNATFIQEVTVFSGPPDPVHGTALHQRVRAAAQELASQLFTDTMSPLPPLSPCEVAVPTVGMGSGSAARSGMQGFGYSPGKQASGGGILHRIQKAAEVVASAVLPPTEHPGIRLHDNRYRAVTAPSVAVEVAVPACSYSLPSHGLKAHRCPGVAGGGWEDSDSGHSSRDSSQENGDISRASVAGSSRSGTGSRESGDLSERVEAVHPGDCGQEVAVVGSLTEGSRVFLSREETQRFLKECAILNCEVVVELLCGKLHEPTHTVQMRALCAIASLMSSDLLSLDQIYASTHKRLAQLSEGTPGPVADKATKILRQFEALMGGAKRQPPSCHTAPGPSARDSLPTLPAAFLLPVAPTEGSGNEKGAPRSDPQLSLTLGPASTSTRGQDGGDVGGEGGRRAIADPCRGSQQPDRRMEPQPEAGPAPDPPGGKLSLFSGMDLVTRGKPARPPVATRGGAETDSSRPGRQQVSAFSFVSL
ncbi:AP-4 complex accessory subunit Tepsin isoform X2 [Scleropages formosus]|uniref:AP-4 complex accessory subunit Tepsin isoform X2 n=1 Tax=Scleropages formosus TaxID=113540 RepID=UPI0010FA80AC|nr:AP-4 complex accessory subunit tepsin isoform X2 [Scleropages formosus]